MSRDQPQEPSAGGGRSLPCPICRKPVGAEAPEYPFCSQRCRTVDLGNWASGVYRIPEKPRLEDEEE
ncbi:MAG TPA: DNA gyrase inhibitor YacG [Terriglobales bacterium]|nr:DNA gyrase inhibitor YacG [Terriglobales bacterium]